MTDKLLEIEGVDIRYKTEGEDLRAVNDASLTIQGGEYFGLVGESGSGKSTLAKSVIGGLDSNGEITSGKIKFQGQEIQGFSEGEYDDQIRWSEISVIPQSAMNSLNPLSRLSEQAIEVVQKHEDWSKDRALSRLKDLFEILGLPKARIHDYPFQFSGGMKQRAIIALSLILNPSLVIADEPTTALDVIMQDKILRYLEDLREKEDLSMLFITHDISVIFELCDRMSVMHGGQIAETGDTLDIYDNPRHPYTILLQQAFPDIRYPYAELKSIEGTPPRLQEDIEFCTFADRCPWAERECRMQAPPLEPVESDESHSTSCFRAEEMPHLASEFLDQDNGEAGDRANVAPRPSKGIQNSDPVLELKGLHKHFDQSANILDTLISKFLGGERSDIRAVDGVDLELGEQEIQGIIGESGCGKSTLLRTLVGVYPPTRGEIHYQGKPISDFSRSDWKQLRRRVQIIFQDPFNTINPHFSVREALAEPLRIHKVAYDEERLHEILEDVRLTPTNQYIDRKESQLSGGEKQRVAIARALVIEPEVILADEPVSMLDVSTQASILELLRELSEEHNVSMIYVSHDLSTVSYICDRVNVMYLGRIVESAPTLELLDDPKHPYTRALTESIPIPDPHFERSGTELPDTASDASNLPSGCRFKDRCPERMTICDERPRFISIPEEDSRQVACHLHYDHDENANTSQEKQIGTAR